MTWIRSYFNLSSGLKDAITVPLGTCEAVKKHIEEITAKCKLEVTQYKDNPPHWTSYTPAPSVDDYTACEAVWGHNRFIREFYDNLSGWAESPPSGDTELFTPEFANSIWYGFSSLHLNYDRWTREAYRGEMDKLFDVMQGDNGHDIVFEEAPLTDKQTAAVIRLFEQYFDKDDIRLELPFGRDFLATSDEYEWCSRHGAILHEDVLVITNENGGINVVDGEDGEYELEFVDGDKAIYDEIYKCPVEGCKEIFNL